VTTSPADGWPAGDAHPEAESPGTARDPRKRIRVVDVLLTEHWDTHQPIFSANSTMIPAGPRT
jgi:hypothetical protein